MNVEVCTDSDLRAALTLVLRTLPADQRAPLVDSLARLREEPLAPFQALVIAKQDGQLQAAAWGQPQAGRSCSLWTPQAAEGAVPDQMAVHMIERVTEIVDNAGVAITQTLLESPTDRMRTPLLMCGFQELSQLSYMQWTPQPAFPSPDPKGITWTPFELTKQRKLEQVVVETYGGTLDFPELDGMREIHDVISGYRCAGEFREANWGQLQRDGRDVGVLLLAEYPESDQIELVYMGIVPAFRGQGIGSIALSFAQQRAVELGSGRMVLAVDQRNKPAQAIYRRAGFMTWAERVAYLRPRQQN